MMTSTLSLHYINVELIQFIFHGCCDIMWKFTLLDPLYVDTLDILDYLHNVYYHDIAGDLLLYLVFFRC